MKNITNVPSMQQCDYCNLKGFFIITPHGADSETCPCCGADDYVNSVWNELRRDYAAEKHQRLQVLLDDECTNDVRSEFRFCDKCNIMFLLGCTHAVAGCTDNVFNAHFIKEWQDKRTNIVYQGMPQFDSVDDWFDHANDVVVLQMHCPHGGHHCKRTSYPICGNLCTISVDVGLIAGDAGIDEFTELLSDVQTGTSLTLPIVTREGLNAKMESQPRRFCFIKCLSSKDQEAFKDKYLTTLNADASQLKYYEHGCIQVSTWLEIMRNIEVECNYRVYRNAYWGENTGSKNVSHKISDSYKSMLVEFGSEHIQTIDLLIADEHISRMVAFRRCSFVNLKQRFWDSFIGSIPFDHLKEM